MTWRMKLGQELGFTVAPKVGSYVEVDTWNRGELLQDCDDWDKAEFRIKTCGGDLAVNVEVTGTTLQHPFDKWTDFVRVKVTFVADKCVDWYTGEMVGEDTVVRGWLKVGAEEKVWL